MRMKNVHSFFVFSCEGFIFIVKVAILKTVYIMESHLRVEPAGGQKMLNGKLWMLVGPKVFSSSEYAAMLCKAAKFMTLVGAATGGDGIGCDPAPVVLPNSGFVVRYSAIYCTTADGASSQEWGTEPDLATPEGEEPLETCLKAIHQEMT